ncbi:MAG: hypothetical protein ABH841_02520 [Candidatus Nealsonbacteria bacterium]
MEEINQQSALVIFGGRLPKKSKKWYQQFNEVIGPEKLKTFISSGNVQEAYQMVNSLSRLTTSDGLRLSKLITYKGYELWWMNYGFIEYKFCLPYLENRKLLEYLKKFGSVYLYRPQHPELFFYFLEAYDCRCVEIKNWRDRLRKRLLPGGVLIQLLLSFLFLPVLMLMRPKAMYRIGDQIDPPHSYDFRHEYVYRELKKRKIKFVEFIRSLQPWHKVLRNAWRRKRPAIYCTAITYFILEKLSFFEKRKDKKLIQKIRSEGRSPEERFWLYCATHFLSGKIRATGWSIEIMELLLKAVGVKASIIISASSRALPEVLGCQLAGIKTIGIQHGLAFCWYLPHDFMPEYDGEKQLSIDKYGLWSAWWKEYYLAHSKAYKQEQLYISGPMRPLEKEPAIVTSADFKAGSLKVLFISEQLAAPEEIMPYLAAALNCKEFVLSLKVRPQADGFEEWLKKNNPGILGKLTISRDDIHKAIAQSDVVVGSHSTAVLEALCQLKPFVFFWTNKWGDYYGIKDFDSQGYFFAASPADFTDKIKKSGQMPKEDLKKLQERFFGDPYQNGSKWVVDQVENFIKKHDAR